MAVAKALGASRIVAVDINQARLNFAKSYVATDIFLPPTLNAGEDKVEYSKRAAEELKQTLGIKDRGPTAIDVVIEASGAETSIQTALFVVKTGGTYVQV
jgi:D-xylulose reductase